MARDNGTGSTGKFAPLVNANVAAYQAMVDDLDNAWANLTEDEQAECKSERARRRAENPLWPYVTSDHMHRLVDRLDKNTKASEKVTAAMTSPEGLNWKMGILTHALDALRETIEKHTENVHVFAQSIDELTAAMRGAHV